MRATTSETLVSSSVTHLFMISITSPRVTSPQGTRSPDRLQDWGAEVVGAPVVAIGDVVVGALVPIVVDAADEVVV